MADSSIPITPGSGANVDTRTASNGDHREVVVVGDATTDNVAKVSAAGDQSVSLTHPNVSAFGFAAGVTPYSRLQTTGEPTTIFRDGFDGTSIDTVNRWTISGTVAPTQGAGGLTVAPGTTNSATTVAQSLNVFQPAGLGFSIFGSLVNLETTPVSTPNLHRFWGLGQVNTYSAATPLTDGAGFEIDTTGALNCVVYVNGTRYVANSTNPALLSSSIAGFAGTGTAVVSGATVSNYGATLTWPAGSKRFSLYFRPDVMYWFIDDTNKPVAVVSYLTPQSSVLPVRLAAATTTSGTVSAATTFVVQSVGLGDTTSGNSTVSDGTYPWRRVNIGKNGGMAIKGSPITTTSGAVAASATGTVGPVDVSEAGNCTFVVKNTVAANAWAGTPVIVFEQSDDNVSWAALPVQRVDTGLISSTHTLGAGAANAELMFNAALPGVAYVRARVTTGPTTNGITVTINPGSLAFQPIVGMQVPARTPVSLTAGPTALTASTALLSGTLARGSAVTATQTYITVSAGKTLRITNFNMNYIATATSAYGVARLVAAYTGTVVAGGTPYRVLAAGAGTPTTANSTGSASTSSVPDGLEFPAGATVGISVIGYSGATGTAAGYIVADIAGYEY